MCCWDDHVITEGGPQCYKVLAKNGLAVKMVVNFYVPAPAQPGDCWSAVDFLGYTLPTVCANNAGVLKLTVSYPSP